jgi:serine/threonine protein phosphatase PrpC
MPTNGPFNRNLLFTCLGSPGKPLIDSSGPFVLQGADRLLLCSDGLWDTVSDDSITEQLSSRSIGEAVPELVEQALRNGGPTCDNVSVMALEWEGAEEAAGATGGLKHTSTHRHRQSPSGPRPKENSDGPRRSGAHAPR